MTRAPRGSASPKCRALARGDSGIPRLFASAGDSFLCLSNPRCRRPCVCVGGGLGPCPVIWGNGVVLLLAELSSNPARATWSTVGTSLTEGSM